MSRGEAEMARPVVILPDLHGRADLLEETLFAILGSRDAG